MSSVLKGNFTVRKPVEAARTPTDSTATPEGSAEELAIALRKAALHSIGGSMVYVERTALTWDGESS